MPRGSASPEPGRATRPTAPSRRLFWCIGLAAVALTATGCGGGGDPERSGTSAQAPSSAAASTDAAATTSAAASTDAPDPAQAVLPSALAQVPRSSAVLRGAHATDLVALTFDDGPSRQTGDVLEILARYGAHATFFVVGSNVDERPDELRAVLEAGHAVGNHSWNHADLSALDADEMGAELRRTSAEIRSVGGYRTRLMRPPYGATNRRVNIAARKRGLLPILWSVDSRDWQTGSTRAQIVRRVMDDVRPGSIILLHDGGGDRSATIEALPIILDALRNRGLTPVTVPELLNEAPPTAADGDLLSGALPAGS